MSEYVIIPVAVFLGVFAVVSVLKSIYVVKQKEVIIVERFGRFHAQLNAGSLLRT